MRARILCAGLLIVIIASISIFGTSIAVEIHAVGKGAYAYVNGSWIQTAPKTMDEITAIWAFGENDIFIGDMNGVVHHYDGSNWSELYACPDKNDIFDIWGISNSDLYVCSGDGVYSRGKFMHFDGSSWTEISMPTPCRYYSSVYGFSDDDIYVVAYDYDDTPNLIYHNSSGDPLSWDPVDISSLGIEMLCVSVWGSSGDDVFIAGMRGEIIHWDGIQWELMESGDTERIYNYEIWGTSSSDVFAVGTIDNTYPLPDSGFVFHYDGETWTEMLVSGTRFKWITGVSSSDVITGGSHGDGEIVMHYDGSNWVEVTGDAYGGSSDAFMFSHDNALLTGYTLLGEYYGKFFRYTGSSIERVDDEYGFLIELYSVTSTPTGSFYAGSAEGDVLAFVNGSWQEIARPATSRIYDIIAFDHNDICVFTSSKAYHFDGVSWEQMGSSEMGCRNAWGLSSDDIYTASGSNSIYHYDGNDWSRVWYEPGWSNEYESWGIRANDIWGTSSDNIYAVGYTSECVWVGPGSACFTCHVLIHFDGMSWTYQAIGGSCPTGYPPYGEDQLFTIWGASEDDIWAAGNDSVLNYNGSDWIGIGSPDSSYSAIWGIPTGPDVYFLHSPAEVHRYDGQGWDITDLPDVELRDIWGTTVGDPNNTIVTVETEPEGPEFSIDGNIYDDSHSFIATLGSTYEIGVVSPQVASDGHEYAFTEWSDGGDTIHTIVAPDTNVTYTAYFERITVEVSVEAYPEGPEFSVGDTVCNEPYAFIAHPGTTFEIGVESPQLDLNGDDYYFKEWSDGGDTIHTIMAPDTSVTYTAYFNRTVDVTITTSPEGLNVWIIDEEYSSPYNFTMISGDEIEIGTSSPQKDKGVDFYFHYWSDGGSRVHTVTLPIDDIEYTAVFESYITGDETDPVPLVNALHQNHPNPFNPSTTISFSLERGGHASLAVYDVAGRLVRVLIDGVVEAGPRDVTWDGRDNAGRGVASGVYFYRLDAVEFVETKKMVLLR